MRRAVLALGFILLLLCSMLDPATAQEPKGLGPGLLGLDGSVGILDKKIAEGKSTIEKATGVVGDCFLQLDRSIQPLSQRRSF